MNAILSQDKRHIVSADALDHIELRNTEIYAHTVCGERIFLGKYKNDICAERVMCYLSFGITSETQKTVVLPPEKLIDDGRGVKGFATVQIAPEFQKIIEDIFGGDKK